MHIMTVSSLNTKIKTLLEATFIHVMVDGEISSVTYHNSGHIYFSIKDDSSTVRCVIWRSNAIKLKFKIQNGERVIIDGSVGVYVPRGDYQFIATSVKPYGKGALVLAFEQLKDKLKQKGYFENSNKKEIPKYPQKIVIVTASNSAALQDILKVAMNRWSMLEITVIDVLVQGDTAAGEIAQAIKHADNMNPDIIIISRGGGSVEDLWSFNEEIVADSIFATKTPIVSAIGHEVDTTISDLVADIRAPTPSAAMEMILPDMNELLLMLDDLVEQMRRIMFHTISAKYQMLSNLRLEFIRSSFSNRLSIMMDQFNRIEHEFVSHIRYRIDMFAQLAKPVESSLSSSIRFVMHSKHRDLDLHTDKLISLDPSKQMRRAWAQINRNGKKVSLDKIDIGDEFDLISDKIKMRVKSIKKEIL